jgi:hypothetical protein
MVELRRSTGSPDAAVASDLGGGDGHLDLGLVECVQSLVEALEGHCLLLLDKRGRLTSASSRAEEVLGPRIWGMVGSSPARIFAHSYVFETMLALAATMSPVEHRDDVILDDGSAVAVQVSASVIVDRHGKAVGYALLFCVHGARSAVAAIGNGHAGETRFVPGPWPSPGDHYRAAARRAADEILAARVALAGATSVHLRPAPVDRSVAEALERLDDAIHALSAGLVVPPPGGAGPGAANGHG